MFSFGKKSTRIGVRAALLAGAVVAVVGLGSVGSASASLSCEGSNIKGKGSSLQKVANEKIWISGFETGICNKGTEPKVTYDPAGSGAGLEEWNHNNVKKSINTEIAFVGTDDAPTTAQIGNITSVSGGAGVLTIPVTQTSIAVPANPPAGCEVGVITNKDLELVFNGTILKWSQLSTNLAAPNPACNFAIKRVVRFDGSGTTFQFKNYLFQINKKPIPCIEGTGPEKTWQELEPIEGGSKPNVSWPEDEGCATTKSAVIKPGAKGGGEVVKKVIETSGAIGYAALPDVESKLVACEETSTCKNTEILALQKDGKSKLSEADFSSPGIPGEEEANCLTTLYTVPVNAQTSKTHTALNVDWSGVFGAKTNTTTTGGGYPLCTLTYDLAFNKYSGPGFTLGQEQTVNDYINEYIVQSAGQAGVATKYYAPLPTSLTLSHNVLGAAKFAASKIGF
jgi:ABC-type phosphate transport system substrate-binding protein